MTDTLTMQDLAETKDTGVLLVSGAGRIEFANNRFQEEFGWPAGSLEGTPMVRIVPPAYRDAHNLAFARFQSKGAGTILGQPLTLPVMTGDGQTKQAEICIFAERRQDGEWLFGATVSGC